MQWQLPVSLESFARIKWGDGHEKTQGYHECGVCLKKIASKTTLPCHQGVLTECIGYSVLHNKLPQMQWLKTTGKLLVHDCVAGLFGSVSAAWSFWSEPGSAVLGQAHAHDWGHSRRGQDLSPCGLLPSSQLTFSCSVLEAFPAQDQNLQGFLPRTCTMYLPTFCATEHLTGSAQSQGLRKETPQPDGRSLCHSLQSITPGLPSTCSFQEENNPSTDQ